MSRKRYSPEKIIGMLREAEVALAQGMTVGQVMSPAIHFRADLLPMAKAIWRSEDQPGQAHEGYRA